MSNQSVKDATAASASPTPSTQDVKMAEINAINSKADAEIASEDASRKAVGSIFSAMKLTMEIVRGAKGAKQVALALLAHPEILAKFLPLVPQILAAGVKVEFWEVKGRIAFNAVYAIFKAATGIEVSSKTFVYGILAAFPEEAGDYAVNNGIPCSLGHLATSEQDFIILGLATSILQSGNNAEKGAAAFKNFNRVRSILWSSKHDVTARFKSQQEKDNALLKNREQQQAMINICHSTIINAKTLGYKKLIQLVQASAYNYTMVPDGYVFNRELHERLAAKALKSKDDSDDE